MNAPLDLSQMPRLGSAPSLLRESEPGDERDPDIGAMGRPARCLMLAHEPFSNHSERLRALRTELLLRREGAGSGMTMALLSPCAGEGRSQLAAELAIAFARMGRPTLLVDADLRRPRQHLLFQLDNRYGLADALCGSSSPMPHRVEALPRLFVMTAGNAPPNPLELLADEQFRELVNQWRSQYGFVVFDTPPVSDYSDGLAVSTVVGQVLMLSRAQHTPYGEARALLRRLAATQARILGSVINHF